MLKFIFCMQIKIDVWYKLILSFWVCVVRHLYIFDAYVSWQYLRKAWDMKLIFDLQINSITLGVRSQECPKYAEQQARNIFAIPQENR